MTNIVKIRSGSELPDREISWLDDTGQLIDFSTGWEFSLRIGTLAKAPLLTKIIGIVGDDTDPNVTISFEEDELDSLPSGLHIAELVANNISSSQDRSMTFWVLVLPTFSP